MRPWTDRELNILLAGRRDGQSFTTLAKRLQRSRSAVARKLHNMKRRRWYWVKDVERPAFRVAVMVRE